MSRPLALVIEDEYDVSIIFSKALEAVGFEAQIIRSGDTALVWLSSTTPDLVILDLNLPRVPGADILHYIRGDTRLARTKVIVATAYSRLVDSLQDEPDWILIKPVTFGQLRNLAARFLPDAPSRQSRNQSAAVVGQVAQAVQSECIEYNDQEE